MIYDNFTILKKIKSVKKNSVILTKKLSDFSQNIKAKKLLPVFKLSKKKIKKHKEKEDLLNKSENLINSVIKSPKKLTNFNFGKRRRGFDATLSFNFNECSENINEIIEEGISDEFPKLIEEYIKIRVFNFFFIH